jgi:mannose-6-phosphate isomerase
MVALSEFWLLHGFKPEQLLKATFLKVSELLPLLSLFEEGSYQSLYEHVMMLPQATVDQMLQPLVERIVPLYNSGTLQKSSEDFWAARAALVYKEEGHIDRGIFSIYFFNLLHLKKGEGIYQPARLPHAYLEGQNVEIMANSDNVLRAGLTDKYIDVPELLKHVDFVPTYPNIMSAEQTGISVFSTPAEEFELTLYSFIKECAWLTEGPEVLLLLEGTAKLEIESEIVSLKRGEALFVSAGKNVVLQGGENTQMYRAAVPVHKK